MEILLALLYPAGFISIVTGLMLYLRKQEIGQRAVRIAKAHLTPAEDIEVGYAAVAASVKALRAAKEEEDQLHIDAWEQEFYTPEEYKALLEKRRHEKMLEEGKIKAQELSVAETKHISAVDREGDEWVPLGHKRKQDPDEDLSYSQRRIQSAGAFVRDAPSDKAYSMGAITGGSVWRFDGWVKGKPIAGNNVWFYYVGEKSGIVKYVWSGATTNRSTTGMPYAGDHYGYESASIKKAVSGNSSASYSADGGFEVRNAAGDVVLKYEPTSYIQLPVAEVARRVAEDANRLTARKYDPVAKQYIPPSTHKVHY